MARREMQFDELPGGLQTDIRETVGEPEFLLIEFDDDYPFPNANVVYDAWAVTARRYTKMMWKGPDEVNVTGPVVDSYRLEDIRKVEVQELPGGGTHGTIHSRDEE